MTRFQKFCLATGLAAIGFLAWLDAILFVLRVA